MHFKKFEINNNPYIGIFATVSNQFGIFPEILKKDEIKIVEKNLEIEVVLRDLGESIVNGAIAKIHKNKVLLSLASSEKDVKFLESKGLDALRLNSYAAVGNLIAINEHGLLLSPEFSEQDIKEIEDFFGKKAKVMNIANISVVGSCIALNNKAMAVYPRISSEEFETLIKLFNVEGNVATVNYGDGLVGNGLLVNDKGILIGSKTTGYEIIRLDDIFG